MLLYIIVTIIYLLLAIFNNIFKVNKKIFTFILILPLFLICSLRAISVGADTITYYNSYISQYGDLFSTIVSRYEIGFVYYMRILQHLGIDYFGFQIITSFFVFMSIGIFIYRYSCNIPFSLYIFFTMHMFFDSMNISRQYLSLSILLFSIKYLKEKNIFKFIMTILIATCFHKMAIVFVLLYPISNMNFNKFKLKLIIILSIIISLYFNKIFVGTINYFGFYNNYIDSKYFNVEGKIFIYVELLLNCCIFLTLFFSKYLLKIFKINKLKYEKIWFSSFLLLLCFSIISLNATIIDRVEVFFKFFLIILIPNIIKNIKNRNNAKILMGLILVGLFLYFLTIMIYRPGWTNVIPYSIY